MDDVVPETSFYSDDVRMLYDMIASQWSLGANELPTMSYEPETFMMNARVGSIFFQQLSRSNSISSVDYRTLQRTSTVSIRIATRFRAVHYTWCDEVYRILMANRRCGKDVLGGYLFIEVQNDRQVPDLSGWYVTVIDVRLTSYNTPIRSAGFGDKLNKKIAEGPNTLG